MDINKVGFKRTNIDTIVGYNDFNGSGGGGSGSSGSGLVGGGGRMYIPYEDNDTSNSCIKRIKLLDSTISSRRVPLQSIYNNNSSSSSNSSYNFNFNYRWLDYDLFDQLSPEVIVQIFGYLDPFSTPLMYICKRWYNILQLNNRSLWRDLVITINDSRPYELKPLSNRVLSYFNNGYGTSLHSFILSTSLTNHESSLVQPSQQQQQPQSQTQSSTLSSINFNNNYNFRNNNNNFFSNLTSYKNNNNTTTNNNQNNQNNDIESQRQFLINVTKSIGHNLSLCPNLRKIEMTLPIDNDQFHALSTNCKNVNDLSLNCFLINDLGMERALQNFNSLEQLSLNSTGNFNYEFVKQTKINQTITPTSLYSISTLLKLKSLRFTLPPQLGNFNKSLVESGIVLDQQQQLAIEDFEQNDLDKAMLCLLKCKYLETLELVSCNITKNALESLMEQLKCLKRLVIYRNNSLVSLTVKSNTLCHLSLSCISVIQNIFIDSNSIEELYVEGCETIQKTIINSPSLKLLSLDGLSGRLYIKECYGLTSLTLSECSGISQRGLERLLDSLVNLQDLCIFLQQILHLRISSSSLKHLDIEAWNGIKSCILDCPSLQELKANESTLETLYFKGNEPSNIELDFCDSLRNIIVDVLSCNSFSFTQDHPSNLSTSNYLLHQQSKELEIEEIDDDDDEEEGDSDMDDDDDSNMQVEERQQEQEEEQDDDRFMSPTSLFIQVHRSIENCTILSGNVIGKISTNSIATLSIEQKSIQSIDLSSIHAIQRLKSYHQAKRNNSDGGCSGSKSPILFQMNHLIIIIILIHFQIFDNI
ncbi:hypothetical protein DFA_05266 [Cavenderia fasciculata]|uniref:F-box domain-containing protein n=1 Tax=Cavenderia fasciculata TaxID=261658 RepID=F4PNT3_CACFS|nr:uncharacterized protein DFA_05266 [Cavenderia fasciculata]EGG23136.1 hypothetical protein DFA_05266 [Cavenderia fasciculata]|eukprot:XP_004360987.1 hypothetical protein DFA_05266 [Cavenderia fasciculata]